MVQVSGSVVRYPARALLISFAVLIVLGAAALCHPACRRSEAEPITVLDALFTATSASCVTGLTVRSTPHDFSFIGQVVIIGLIQVGGIGIMTLTTLVVFMLGTRSSLRQQALIESTLGASVGPRDLSRLLWRVIAVTLGIEAVGAIILSVRNILGGMEPPQAVWHGVFHSVSAFCNAGFALFDDNLSPYAADWVVCSTVCVLILLGGIGYPVLLDMYNRRGSPDWRTYWDKLQMHTKIMVLGTSLLWVVPSIAVLLFEWDRTLEPLPLHAKPLAAITHCVSCRTAGFNTVDVGAMTSATLFLSIALMIVGAGACSTAGGFKVSTAAIILLRAWATFRGRSRLNVFRRTIPRETVERAIATAFLFLVISALALTWLLVIEENTDLHVSRKGKFLELLFEAVSALGTVGLSTGVTPYLSSAGRIAIIALMFLGRVGPITVFAALSMGEKRDPVEYSSEEPLVG